VRASSAKRYLLGSAATLATIAESVLHASSLDPTIKLNAAVKKVSALDAGGASKTLAAPGTLGR
jgi:hypothetical protein